MQKKQKKQSYRFREQLVKDSLSEQQADLTRFIGQVQQNTTPMTQLTKKTSLVLQNQTDKEKHKKRHFALK